MKIGVFHIMLRLFGCVLVLFPHYALAGAVSIPGFYSGHNVTPPLQVVQPTVKSSVPINIPGFFGSNVAPPTQNTVPVLKDNGVVQGATVEYPSANQCVVNQNQQNAIIDWKNFNISSDASVRFDQQGNASWSALNRIWDANPSMIFGKLKADGKIYLINQNGILFGQGSIVNVNSLVASALNIKNTDFLNPKNGRLPFYQETGNMGTVDFDLSGKTYSYSLISYLPDAAVSNYGEIDAANNGYVFLMAPRVENAGVVNAPLGQAGLVAGISAALTPSQSVSRSGYYDVSVTEPQNSGADCGRALNQESGRLWADGGVAGMYGNNVDQWGVIRSVTAFHNKQGQVELKAANKITTGANSSIDLHVFDSVDQATGRLPTVDDTFVIQPTVDMRGLDQLTPVNQIELGGSIVAPAGTVTIVAKDHVVLDAGSNIDVSGVKVSGLPLPLVAGFALNSVELRDDYEQKGGVLQGQKITTTATSGSTIGDLSQAVLTRDRIAQERLIGGAMKKNPDGSYSAQTGAISITSSGDIIVKQDSKLDFSGGVINYAGGFANSTKLLSGMKIYDISNAPLNIHYDKVLGNFEKTYDRFGIRESYSGLYYGGASSLMTYVKGYTQGGDAGTLTLSAPLVVLDGELNGKVTHGQYQNTWTTLGSTQDYALSKAKGLEAPQEGTLNIGTEGATAGKNPETIKVLPETEAADSSPAAGQPTLISAKTLNNANLNTVNLYADLTIKTDANANIALQSGGSFKATARQIDHAGKIMVPAGSISLIINQNDTSASGKDGSKQITDPTNIITYNNNYKQIDERIILGSLSGLDVSGEKIDNSHVGSADRESLKYGQTRGGSISILDQTDKGSGVIIPEGAVVDVSGGYSIDQKGKITGGNAGKLTIQGSNIQLDGDLRGYALADPNGKVTGGSLTLYSTEIHVGVGTSPAPQGSFVLAENRLDDTGFTQIALNSRNDLVVEENTKISPSLVRLNNPVEAGSSASAQNQGQGVYGTELAGRPDLIRLDPTMSYLAGSSAFSAQAGCPFKGSSTQGFTGNLIDKGAGNYTASIMVSMGAEIHTTPSAQSLISLSGPGIPTSPTQKGTPGVTVDGKLESPGGNISVTATNSDLLIGDNAEILATGFNRPDPSSTPKGFGVNKQPMNGGNVSLTAANSLNLSGGAWVDVSGSDAITNTVLVNGTITTYKDAGSPGSVSLTYGANEGKLNWQGAVTAWHANLEGISGGSLKLIDNDTTNGMVIKSGDLGYYLDKDYGGFDDLTFRSQKSLSFSDATYNFTIGRKLTLDAPEIQGSAGQSVTLSGVPWIVVTNTSSLAPSQPSPSSTTTGSKISLSGQWIDLIGSVNFTGFDDVTLQAAHDIRLSQALYSDNKVRNGQLNTTGNLVLDAERIYPGNYYQFYSNGKSSNIIYPDLYSDYIVHAGKTVTLKHTGKDNNTADDQPIYSAGGSLVVEGLGGIDVESGVKVAAPMGQISLTTLNAPGKRIYLADGSVLTTAGNTAVNYGLIDSSNIWVYNSDKSKPQSDADNATATFSGNSLPGKSVTLNADEVISQPGSKIDVSGGGSVFGYRFQPGVNGSVDPLTKPGRYIVFKNDSLPMPGTAVHLQAGGGLTEGDYTLLPLDMNNPQNARYAFLPGAFILEKQSTSALPGQTTKDGYPLVVGYSEVKDTTIRSSRPQIYSVRSAQDVLAQEGSYEMQSMTAGNGGAITLNGKTTIIGGSFKGAALPGYLGGTLSLSGTNIVVQTTAASDLPAGFNFNSPDSDLGTMQNTLTVSTDGLSGQGFREVDLGDVDPSRSATNSITVKAGADLSADIVSLAARKTTDAAGKATDPSIILETGAKLTATSGDGLITLTTPGNLQLQSGSTVHASHGITLDVNNVDDISGNLLVDNSALTLKSSEIFFGSLDNGTAPGLYLTQSKWNSFVTFEDITLVSGSDIQFNDPSIKNLSAARSLTFDAKKIDGNGNTVTVSAQTVNLKNSGSASQDPNTAQSQNGTFTVNASDQINVGGGDVLFGGFKTIGLNSTNDLTFMGKGSLTTGNANLNISAARVTAAGMSRTVNNSFGTNSAALTAANFRVYTGANYNIDHDNPNPAGSITMTKSGGMPATTPTAPGTLEFQGTSIDQGGVIQVNGGNIKLVATGSNSTDGIFMHNGAEILATGTDDAPGGQVTLSTDSGKIGLDMNSVIDVSAGDQGDAGTINLSAPTGGVTLGGILTGQANGGIGGSFVLDTLRLSNTDYTDVPHLIGTLINGGFTESVDIQARTGNIVIDSGQTLQAHHVKLTADDQTAGKGTISINKNGKIDASGDAGHTDGGTVELYAYNDINIDGNINAYGSNGGKGGDVLLSSSSTNGWVNVNNGGNIDVHGDAGGTDGNVYLRAQRSIANDDVNISLAGPDAITGARAVYAEAFKTYDDDNPSTTLSQSINDAKSFYSVFDDNTSSLHRLAAVSNFHLLPGIELDSSVSINWSTAWDQYLAQYDENGKIVANDTLTRFGTANEPGVLTLRAANDLNINGNLTDAPSGSSLTSVSSGRNSWAFNLVAGADTWSADPLAVNRSGTGDLNIADQVVVYTESAPIHFASARDTNIGTAPVLGYMVNGSSMGYNLASFSGSVNGNVGRDLNVGGAIQTATGDIDINVGRDLDLLAGGAESGAGAIRTTGRRSASTPYPAVIDEKTGLPENISQYDTNETYYWQYDSGGNITLSVGGNVGKFSSGQWTAADTGAWDYFSTIQVEASYPAYYGLFSADYNNGTAGLATMGGGNLFVRTGGDFLAQAGTFGSGNLAINSNGDVKGRFLNSDGQGEIHAAGNFGSVDHRAQLELCNSKMDVTAEGELQIGAVLNPTLASDKFLSDGTARDYAYAHCTYTPDTTVSLKAGTDVTLAGTSSYYKSSINYLSPLSETVMPANVNISAKADIFLLNKFVMTSSPKGNLSLSAGGDLHGHDPDASIPAGFLMSDISAQNWFGLFPIDASEQGGRWINTRQLNNHGLYTPADNTKWALTDPLHKNDINPITVHADGDISNVTLVFPKQADVTAGKDIRDINYEGQNINVNDVSTIRAGNDIVMKYSAASNSGGLIQGGPGVFMVQAGGSIDLGSLKDGIQATGNGHNVNLDTAKSSLVILSGYELDKTESDISSFFDTIRKAGDDYSAFMSAGKLDDGAKLLQKTRDATINSLLGAPTGAGDINMSSSQIATTAENSDIFVIANGNLNLGQTALPTPGAAAKTTGITTADGGGINLFARKDINVNESRVMTFYGGDITVWSDQGSINAGRGSRTAVSASAPQTKVDANGVTSIVFTPPAVGSGIRAVTYGDNPPPPGNIHLFAPNGVIDAGEAGIAGGQITLAALKVNNAANISFSAGSIGVPQASEGAASLGTLTGSGITQNTQVNADSSGMSVSRAQAAQMVEDIIAKWLDVKVVDFVDDENKEE